ncbi:hypothetical protein FRC12_001854 [Ceratobasidium sp. 428]|nr:hypothetical protein FRC12_001854 [Ceratobasidium sp. 428]
MVESTLLPATLAAGVILLMLKLWYKSTSSDLPLPPSPRSYPIIGNLLSMPQTFEHLAFEKIGKQLGSDIFSLSVFGTTLVVLNSARAAGDLFEKRSTIYSDRVCPPMLGEPSLLDAGSMMIVVGYNDRWRRYRRMLHPWLQKKATETFYTAQEHQARLLLRRLLDSSHHLGSSRELEGELYRAVAATIFKSVYGYDVKSADDHFMALTKEASDNLGHGILASNFFVNVFPALVHLPDWFPGTNWKKTAHKWRKQKEEAVNGIYNWTKAQIAQGINEPSIIASLLSDSHELDLEDSEVDNDVKYMAFTLITGKSNLLSL